MRTHLRWALPTLLVWASCPGQAKAHLVSSGLGPFYDGATHFFVTPEDLLVVIALGMLAGLGGKQHARWVLLLLPFAWLTGSCVGRVMPTTPEMPIVSASSLILSGTLVAIGYQRWLSVRFAAGFAVTVGLVHGFFNGAALGGTSSDVLAVGGILCALFVVVSLMAGQVVVLQREWARIAVRVVGSWIGAIGLLMFGWAAQHMV
jgi:hypothetical protein